VTNIVDADTALNSLAYNQNSTSGTYFGTTQINDGLTLTINGATNTTGANGNMVYVGSGTVGTGAFLTQTNFVNQGTTPASSTAGGTLKVDNTAGDMVVRQLNTATGTYYALLDLSGLSNFIANVRNLNVAVGDTSGNTRAQGGLWLAGNNTIIAVAGIQVGAQPGGGGTSGNPSAQLVLGNANTINTPSLVVGGRGTGNGTISCTTTFGPGITDGSWVLRGAAGGSSRTNVGIGVQALNDSTISTSTLGNHIDLGTGTTGPTFNTIPGGGSTTFGKGSINAMIDQLNIGRAGATTAARQGIGTLTYGAGNVDVNDVFLGDDGATQIATTSSGTLNVKSVVLGSGQKSATMVVNDKIWLGYIHGSGGTITGTINVDGAISLNPNGSPSLRVSGPIEDKGGTSNINVKNGGSLQARGLGTSTSPIDNLNLDGGTVVVDIGGSVPVTNWGYVTNMSANSTSGNINTIGLQFTGTLTTGTFPGISYSGSITGTGGFGSFVMAKQPARVTAHLVNNPNSLDISIDTADSPKWDGTVNGDWDIQDQPTAGGGTANWKLISAASATKYQEDLVTYSTTDTVLFDDTATGTTNVNVATTVKPNAVTVNNSTKSYTFSGSGKISGATGITKKGSNTLTISNTGGNDFTGALDIQGGTVNTGANELLPDAGAITLEAGGSFDLGSHTETVSTVNVSGGNYTQASGSLIVGALNITSGNLSAGAGTITATTMNITGGNVSAGTGTIAGTTLNLGGGVTLSPASGSITATTINLIDGTLGAGTISPTTIVAQKGAINSTFTGTGSLTKNGTDVVTVTGNNTYSGVTTVNTGMLLINSNNALGSTAGNTLIDNGGSTGTNALQLTGNISVPEPIQIRGRKGTGTPPFNFNPHIINVSGNNTLSGNISLLTGGTNYALQSDAGNLLISGNVVNDTGVSGTGTARFLYLRGASTGEISGGINDGTGSGPTTVDKMDSGTWTLSGTNTTTMTSTVVEAGKLILASPLYQTATLQTLANATAQMAPSGGNHVLRFDNFTYASGSNSKLDIGDNKIITKANVGTAVGPTYTNMSGVIQQGRNANTSSTWTGDGIVTTQTLATTGNLTSIGIASASEVKGLAAGSTDTAVWAGQTVTATDTLIMYTYGGDANLDGKINVDDYGRIDFAVPLGIAGWSNGDFNYDGKINVDDYGIIDFNVGIQGPPFPTAGGASTSGLNAVAVPEPAVVGLLALGALLPRARRRRQR